MAKARKSTSSGGNDILALLSPERRKQVLDEVAGARLRGLFEQYQGSSWGELVAALRSDERWDLMRQVPLAQVIRPTGGGAPARAPASPRPAAKRGGRRRGIDQSVIDSILKFVQRTPGLRSEEIQSRMNMDKKVVKRALAKLREKKLVKTSGHKRSTTYASA